jgi:Protein of unknown function (DUF2786)
MTDRERIIDRIQKLKRHAESAEGIGNQAEAEAFAQAFKRLLDDHKIEMTDLEFEQMEREEPVDRYPIDYRKYPDIRLRSNRVGWIEKLAGVIARAHFCRIMVTPGSSRITLVGRKTDAQVAEYMFITLQRAADKLCQKEHQKFAWECYRADGHCRRARGFKESFLKSFVVRLNERYEEERLRRQGEGNTQALVRIERSGAAVDAYLKTGNDGKKFPKAGGLSRNMAFNADGITRGRAAADGIDLGGKAVTGAAAGKRELGS